MAQIYWNFGFGLSCWCWVVLSDGIYMYVHVYFVLNHGEADRHVGGLFIYPPHAQGGSGCKQISASSINRRVWSSRSSPQLWQRSGSPTLAATAMMPTRDLTGACCVHMRAISNWSCVTWYVTLNVTRVQPPLLQGLQMKSLCALSADHVTTSQWQCTKVVMWHLH